MPTNRRNAIAIAAIAAIGLTTAATPALATGAGSWEVAQAGTFGEETLRAFVTAVIKVEDVRTEYTEAIEAAPNDQERSALLQEAQDEMVAAVEETPGITVARYNEIFEAVSANPQLANRVNRMMEAERQ